MMMDILSFGFYCDDDDRMNDRAISAPECLFSSCRRYRYSWQIDLPTNLGNGMCAFIGVNPSTADENGPDPTIRRCINYALSWGYGRIAMLNLFAFRSTDPSVMLKEPNPVGADNDRVLRLVGESADIVVAAWGNHGLHMDRWRVVCEIFPVLHALKITGAGMPCHPLYLKSDLKPFVWRTS